MFFVIVDFANFMNWPDFSITWVIVFDALLCEAYGFFYPTSAILRARLLKLIGMTNLDLFIFLFVPGSVCSPDAVDGES